MAGWAHGQYLLLMGGCLLLTLPLEFLGARVYRRPGRLVRSVLPVAIVFLAWDELAVAGRVWTYNPRYVTGVDVPVHVPIEELVFFLVIPVCGLLTFGCVRAMLRSSPRRSRRPRRSRPEPVGERSAALIGLGYTAPAVLVALAVCVWELRVLRTGLFRRVEYWLSMAIVFGFQVPVDGWLTKLSAPIVVYAPHGSLGIRWPWDIPVEDFLFGFALVTATLLLWVRQEEKETRSPR